MGGTKIVVFQLKDIIKKMVFFIIGVGIIIFLIALFIPNDKTTKEDSASLYKPGTYYSEIILHNSPVRVMVTVSENSIENIAISDLDQTQTVFYPLFQPAMDNLSKEIVKAQSLEVKTNLDSVYTEEILIDAIRTALSKAEQGI